jgi:hypothetical protein
MTHGGAAADEFAIRYYRWALEDFRREIAQDFPLLRPIKDSLAIRLTGHMQSLDAGERGRLATALVKRAHKRAVELTGDPWGAEEGPLVERYRTISRIPRPEEEAYRRALFDDPQSLKLNRGALLAHVKRALAPVLGEGAPFSTEHEWRYAMPIGAWTLSTFVDVGGSTHQLSYGHAIHSGDRRILKEGISVLSWLGIGGAHTQWNQLTSADIESGAAALSRVCRHFVDVGPELLAGVPGA